MVAARGVATSGVLTAVNCVCWRKRIILISCEAELLWRWRQRSSMRVKMREMRAVIDLSTMRRAYGGEKNVEIIIACIMKLFSALTQCVRSYISRVSVSVIIASELEVLLAAAT